MRPLQLKLKGINSYREEQVIDFETLTSQGLFGIFGPTGSGKSSILDAMTLALYAKLPRDTKNFINTNEKTAAVSFLFSITTDKTRKYLAERSFRYHTGNATPTVRNTTGRLILYEGETETVLADKPTDVTTECIHLLGLTSEDFMRTVVLPQGQFSEFLRLKNKERRVMLQRIFHLEKYGIELTGKIARARQKQDLLLSKIDGEKKAYEDISSEALSKLKKEKNAQKKQYSSLSDTLTTLEKSFQETDELYTLQQQLIPLKETKAKKEKELSSIEEKEQNLDTAKRASQLRPFFEQVSNTKTAWDNAATQLKTLQKETRFCTLRFEEAKQEYEQAQHSQEKEIPALQLEEQKLKAAQSSAATILKWTDEQTNFEKELQTVSTSLSPQKEQQKQYIDKEQQLRLEIQSIEKELDAELITPEKRQLLVDGNFMETSYRTSHQNYMNSSRDLSALKKEIEKEEEAFDLQTDTLYALYRHLLHRLSYLKEQQTAVTEQLNLLNKKIEENQQAQKAWQQDHMAQLLREELEEGSLCPVCGAPYSSHASSLFEHSEKSKNVKKDQISIEKARQELEEKKQQQQDILRQFEKELYSLNNQLTSLKNALEITDMSEELSDKAFDSSASVSVPDYSSISRQISEYLPAKGDLRRQKNQYTKQESELKEEYKLLQKQAEQIFALRKEHNIEHFSDALDLLKKAEQERQVQEKQLKEKRQLVESVLPKKEQLSKEIISLEKERASLLSGIENCKKIIAQQREIFPKTFAVDMDFDTAITKLQEKQQAIVTHFKNAQTAYQTENENLQNKKKELSSCESAENSAHKHYEQASQIYDSQKQSLGFSVTEQPEQYYLEEEQLTQLEEYITTYRNETRRIEERIRFLEEKLGNQEVKESEWTSQKEELSNTKQQIKDLESSILLLEHQIEVMSKDLDKKKELEQQWEQEKHKKDMIKELEQLFKGNAFIEYVAQSKLSYIAREASVILSKISGGNYALEINESAEFIIRDNKNGGAVRPSDTLSGGEMFITSLSLALALSSSIQLNGAAPLEFFFLDEGFGSLDDDLLDMVMNSLERLQSRKRSIGIISHVEAIQARVPVKLLVTPSDLSQKGSQIALEYS